MKQKDIAVIIVVAFFSGVLSYFVSNKIFVTPANRQQKVEVVDKINATFVTPDSHFFNPQSIDPTKTTQITSNNNTNPFNSSSQ